MRFGILGTTAAWTGDGAELALGGPGRRALLALLLLDAGRTVGTDRLVDGLYGEAPPNNVANALQSQVSRLRGVLAQVGATVEGGPGGYRLSVSPDEVDAHVFERLAAEGRSALAAGAAAEAHAALTEALGLWRGEPLSDVGGAPFAAGQVVRLTELRLGAVETRAEAALALGRHAEVIAGLRQAVAADPLRERLTTLLMRALYAAGRQADALAAYAALRAALADALGADPGPETAELHLAILRADPALRQASAAAEPAGPAAVAAAPAPAPAPEPVPASVLPLPPVPRPLTTFVGREPELAALDATLRAARLVTLTGPGGTGKTRLALELAARRSASEEEGGACFADLSRVGDGSGLAQALLGALGVREAGVLGPTAPTGDAVARLAPALARRGDLLLVLDNCEQIVAEVAQLAESLLNACPELRILATSREPLAVPGEHVRPLEPLPDAEALRLFAERAAAVRPGFALEGLPAADASAVAEICRRLDGLPLAIELAAARLRMLTPRQIADRLDDRFRLLTGGSRTAQPRQQTLRAVVDWSWDLLPEPERELLRRVSVFSGGWTLDAAEAVCGGGEVAADHTLDLLGALVDKSLVVAHQAPDSGGMRYRMLETVRAYAAERLDAADEQRHYADAHLAHFAALALKAEPQLRTAAQLDWLARLAADHSNLTAALRHAVATDPEQQALDLLAALSGYWMLRGLRTEGRALAVRLLDALGGAIPPGREEQFVLAVMTAISGGMDTPELVAAVDLCRPVMDRLMFAHPLRFPFLIVQWAPFVGVPDDVSTAAQNAAIASLADDPWYRGLLHTGMGFQHWYLRADLAETEREFGEALDCFEQQGERWGMVMALMELARARGRRGDRAASAACTDRALSLAGELQSVEDMAELLWSRADFSIRADDLDAAEADLLRAVRLVEPLGVSDNLAQARLGLAEVALSRGETARARELCASAMASRLVGWTSGELMESAVHMTEARIALHEGDREAAAAGLRAAFSVVSRTRNLPAYGELAGTAAALESVSGRPGTAAELCGVAESLSLPGTRRHPAGLTESLREALGATAYEAAFARGQAGARRDPKDAVAFLAGLLRTD
ncbi:AfsR/SARP family transcriptional regulator [Streptacidiphilus fuscans]|uniref:AAA family ATPase n=1 Tax=Streptacidiphilus fuscans TaxID=2789292 RepID=A0A931B7F3_9ACTN|nr:BTAD domain-containing putative transcriptional regulator [Streptacidiphilus fuscans]MBF9070852.1 AAA family ATPase [Streptacidiphilus fuscans]